jgi:mannosyltransferase
LYRPDRKNQQAMEEKGTRVPVSFWVLLLGAIGLRLFHLTTKNLWFDEAWSWYESQQPVARIIEGCATDIHPPLYHLLLRFWTILFGESPFALRTPSLLANLVTLVAAFVIARRVMSERMALTTLFFLALSPHQVYFAQEARMYALVTAFSLVAVFFYLRLLEDGRFRPGDQIGYVLCTTLAVYTHNFAWLVVGGVWFHFLGVVWSRLKGGQPVAPLFGRWVYLHLAVLVLFSPWLGPFLFQVGVRPRQGWRPPLTTTGVFVGDLLFFGKMIVGYFVFPPQGAELWRGFLHEPWSGERLFTVLRSASLYPLAVMVSLILLLRGLMAPVRLVPILFCVPLGVVTALLLVLKQASDLGRYLMLISPYFFMLLAAGTDRVRSPRRRWAVMGGVALMMGVGLLQHYRATSYDSDYRPVARILKTEGRPGDRILVDPVYMVRCLRYYLRDDSLREGLVELPSLSTVIQNGFARFDAKRLWIALDYRSSLFRAGTEKILLPEASWRITRDERLPERWPRVRLLRLERK